MLHISIQVCQYLPVWQIRSVYVQYLWFCRRYNVKPRYKPIRWPLRNAHALRHVTCRYGPATTRNLETLTPICLFTIQLSGATMMITGSLLRSVPVVKRFKAIKWPLRMRCVTWPVGERPETTKNLETLTPICLFTIQLSEGYDDDYG